MDLMFATMINKMKKELLKEVFQKLGIVLSEDTLKDFSPRKTESVCEAIKQLTEDEIRKLGHAFERISLVGGSRQNIALISAALLDWNVYHYRRDATVYGHESRDLGLSSSAR